MFWPWPWLRKRSRQGFMQYIICRVIFYFCQLWCSFIHWIVHGTDIVVFITDWEHQCHYFIDNSRESFNYIDFQNQTSLGKVKPPNSGLCFPVSTGMRSRLQTVIANVIPVSGIYPERDPDFRRLSRLIPPISPGFHRDPDGIPFSFSLGYRIFIFHPILMRFVLLNELCWELLMICQQISSLFYGFWEKLDRKRP